VFSVWLLPVTGLDGTSARTSCRSGSVSCLRFQRVRHNTILLGPVQKIAWKDHARCLVCEDLGIEGAVYPQNWVEGRVLTGRFIVNHMGLAAECFQVSELAENHQPHEQASSMSVRSKAVDGTEGCPQCG
jgi:hypothetical protein